MQQLTLKEPRRQKITNYNERNQSKMRKNRIPTTLLERKVNNQRSEVPPAKMNESIEGNELVSFLLDVEFRYKVIFQATKSFSFQN